MAIQPDTQNQGGYSLAEILGLDAFTSDGIQVGNIARFLDSVSEDADAFQTYPVDTTDSGGRLVGERHVVINCQGFPLQAEIIVPEGQVTFDFAGRRAILHLTMDALRKVPRIDPLEPDRRPLNEA